MYNYRIDIDYYDFENGNGYSHTETVDNFTAAAPLDATEITERLNNLIAEWMFAEEHYTCYVKLYDNYTDTLLTEIRAN